MYVLFIPRFWAEAGQCALKTVFNSSVVEQDSVAIRVDLPLTDL
jgi:hypothetical protein